MRVLSLLLLVLMLGAAPVLGQQNYFEKQAAFFEGRPATVFKATLLKAKQDYLIVSNPEGQQIVVWVTRYATLRKKHNGMFNKTRKVYIEELVPGTEAKVEAVADEDGRWLLKRFTVYDTVQEFEPTE